MPFTDGAAKGIAGQKKTFPVLLKKCQLQQKFPFTTSNWCSYFRPQDEIQRQRKMATEAAVSVDNATTVRLCVLLHRLIPQDRIQTTRQRLFPIILLDDSVVIEKILTHLDEKDAAAEASRQPRCRAPPQVGLFD